jgi:hypothetical protein
MDVGCLGPGQQPLDEALDGGAFYDVRVAEHVVLVERAQRQHPGAELLGHFVITTDF